MTIEDTPEAAEAAVEAMIPDPPITEIRNASNEVVYREMWNPDEPPVGFASMYDDVCAMHADAVKRLVELRAQRERINDEIAELVEAESALELAVNAFDRRRERILGREGTTMPIQADD